MVTDDLHQPPVQFTSQEVGIVLDLLRSNDYDSAYVLGVMAQVLLHLANRTRRGDFQAQAENLLELRRKWLNDYPALERMRIERK